MPGMRSMNPLHRVLDFLHEWGGIMYSGTTQHYPDSRVRLIYLMDTERLLICGTTNYKHYDVLRPSSWAQIFTPNYGVQVLSKFPLDQVFESIL